MPHSGIICLLKYYVTETHNNWSRGCPITTYNVYRRLFLNSLTVYQTSTPIRQSSHLRTGWLGGGCFNSVVTVAPAVAATAAARNIINSQDERFIMNDSKFLEDFTFQWSWPKIKVAFKVTKIALVTEIKSQQLSQWVWNLAKSLVRTWSVSRKIVRKRFCSKLTYPLILPKNQPNGFSPPLPLIGNLLLS